MQYGLVFCVPDRTLHVHAADEHDFRVCLFPLIHACAKTSASSHTVERVGSMIMVLTALLTLKRLFAYY